eukprot:gene8102-8970_t
MHAVIAVLNFIMIPCTLATNIALLYSLSKTRQLGSVVNNLFMCLCVSDCCIATIVQSLIAVLFTVYRHEHACYVEMSAQFLTFLFGHFSGFVIVVIGIDRYIHMKYLQKYDSIVTKRRAVLTLILCGFAALAIAAGYTLSTIYDVFQWLNMSILLIDLAAIMTIYTAYCQAYYKVKQHLKRTKGLRTTVASPSSPRSKKMRPAAPSYAMSMIVTIVLILGAVFLCYVPYVCVGMMAFYRVQMKQQQLSPALAFSIYLTYLFVYLNSFLNAAIFIYKNDAVRKLLRSKLGITRSKKYDTTLTPSTSSIQLSTFVISNRIKTSGSNDSIVSSVKDGAITPTTSMVNLIN